MEFNFNTLYDWIKTPLEIAALVIWTWLIWSGTRTYNFFSKRNALIVFTTSVGIISMKIIGVVKVFKQEELLLNEGFIIILITLSN